MADKPKDRYTDAEVARVIGARPNANASRYRDTRPDVIKGSTDAATDFAVFDDLGVRVIPSGWRSVE